MPKRSSISLLLFFVLVSTVNAENAALSVGQFHDLELASARLGTAGEFDTVAVAFSRFDSRRDASLTDFQVPAIRESSNLLMNVGGVFNNSTDWVFGHNRLGSVGYASNSLSAVVTVPPLMALGALSKSIFIVAWTAVGLFGCIGAVWYRFRG